MEVELKNINPKFVELFTQTFAFTEEEFALFLSSFKCKTISKKDYYLRAGEVCKSKAYLNKGCARNFVLDEQGHERILFFPFEDWWLGDFDSYYSGNPGTNYIQMLEDSELLVISKEKFQKAEQEIPKLKQWYSSKMLRSAIASRNRIEEMKTLSAEERYLKLIEKQPHIFLRIPLQHIASYLNIEPQSLSRMRNRLTNKH
ncbi:Crp/Fnr family transcriptional regulator [Flavihumibacter profundi]|uniref:Crp/Fnr family transcriptional regulator n=1 Tax=Flavihumibacter profundi TaxID=2716883 RepID=UPI001CC70B86|nr:Crp/Fnr family transcriptional regulator [Flavihumibacter profundi]MBZ5857404.1 Crp/Fnr family transcriptional regulator [Flavihumibacter profundi]